MLKSIHELTEEDKQRYYRRVVSEYKMNNGASWEGFEQKMQAFLDRIFDDGCFLEMSENEQSVAAHCRQAFGGKKPGLVDFMVWQGAFVSGTEYVDVPD